MENSIDHIITRILSGNSSSEDFISLSEWLNADEKNKKEFRSLKSYWDADVSFHHFLMPNVSLDNLRKKIYAQSRQKRLKRIGLIATPIAAAIALLVLLFTTTQIKTSDDTKVQQFYTYVTDKNKSRFTLDDGTKIILNRNSRLTYSDAYGTDKRMVKLVGEAYFEVAKNPEKPFIVDMGNASIRVLGTTFSVKADKGKDQITAVLQEGAIRFDSPTQQTLLAPDQQLTFSRSTNKINIQSVNAKESHAWKDGLLKYKSIALCTLLNELEKRYEVPIHIRNEKLMDPNVTVSGTFSEDQSLKEILQVISRSIPIKWSQRNGIYYIQ